MNKKGILLVLLTVSSFYLAAQNAVIGTWKTIDDGSGEAKSHIDIYEKEGKIFGKITKLLDSEPGVVCENCKGSRKDQPVLGMVILEDLQAYKDYFRKGTILDPENGNTYKCSIWIEKENPDELKVRGIHWTGLYRTQTWHRIKNP